MRKKVQVLLRRYATLNKRERLLVAAAVAAVLITLWAQLLYGPLQGKYAVRHNELTTLKTTLATQHAQHSLLLAQRNQDPNQEIKLRLARTQQEIAKLDRQLQEKLRGLIAPQQMPGVLEAMLKQNTNLQLTRVQTLGARPLIPKKPDENDEQDPGTKAPNVEIYRHGVEIEFTGSYLAMLDYLKALQSLPWEFYWDAVKFDVEKYPLARVVITVHTLSLQEGWIGV